MIDTAERERIIATLIDRHGPAHSEELGIDLSANDPDSLFHWLCAALLMSAPISSALAMRAADALGKAGWTSAHAMAGSTWDERVRVLNGAGYGRFDEKTATMLGEVAEKIVSKYGDDLRNLREAAGREPACERYLLKDFKGIGDAGADIFLREVQTAWDEVYPFADRKALKAAERFGLPASAEELSAAVDRESFPTLLSALVRADLANADPATLAAGPTGSA